MKRNTHNPLLFLVIMVLIGAVAPVPTSADTKSVSTNMPAFVLVTQESESPEGSANVTSYLYRRDGMGYRSTVKEVPLSTIAEIEKIAVEEKNSIGPDLVEFGITEQRVHDNIDVLVSSTGVFKSLSEVPEKFKGLFDFKTVSKYATKVLTDKSEDPCFAIKVVLSGEPDLVVTTRSLNVWYLPWTVSRGKETWLCYSKKLPLLIANLCTEQWAESIRSDRDTVHRTHAPRGDYRDHWPDVFFVNYDYWINDEGIESFEVEEQAKKLPGYDAVKETFSIINGQKYWTWPYICLKTPNGSAIDYIGWDEKDGWNLLEKRFKVAEQAVKQIPFILKWKKSAPNRSVFIEVLRKPEESKYDETLKKIWAEAHHQSTLPLVHVYLWTNGACSNDVYCGEANEPILVTDLGYPRKPRSGGLVIMENKAFALLHPFQAYKGGFSGLQPPYLEERVWELLSPDGSKIKNSPIPAHYADALQADKVNSTDDSKLVWRDWYKDPTAYEDLDQLAHRTFSFIDFDHSWRGLVNSKGKIVIQPEYKAIGPFSEGFATITNKDGRVGFVNTDGKVVIPFEYDDAKPFKDGLAPVSKDGKWGFVDTNGRLAVEMKFNCAKRFNEGLAPVREKYLFGYIDKTGNYVIEPTYTCARRFRDGVAHVQLDGHVSCINHAGKVVSEPPRARVDLNDRFIDGMKIVSTKDSQKQGVQDRSGHFVIKPEFDELGTPGYGTPFAEGLIPARAGEKWGVIDKSGKAIVSPQFDKVFPFENGYAVVQTGIKYGYINAQGELLFPPQFDTADRFEAAGVAQIGKRLEPLEIQLP